MDRENNRTEPQHSRIPPFRFFIKPAIIIAAFAIILSYVLFHFDSLKNAGTVFLDAVNPIICGFFMAYILNVFMNLFENVVFGKLTRSGNKVWNAVRRPICIVLAFAVVITIILSITLYIVPEIIQSLDLIFETAKTNIPVYVQTVTEWITLLSQELNLDLVNSLDFLKDFNWTSVLTGATEITSNFVNSLFSALGNVASGIITAVLTIIFSIYYLAGKESLLLSLKRILYSFLPKKAVATISDIGITANHIFASFVRGQLTECVILGCLCFIGMSIIGFDYALLISSIIALTSLIPILGAYIGCAIGAFLLLLVNPMDAVIFVIFIICLQQFEGNVIYPKVVGSTIGLPGVWVMTAVTIGSNLFGIMGVILGTPLAAVAYTILRRITSNRLYEKGLSNEDLAPGKYPYLEESHYASRASGRPMSAHVLERSGKDFVKSKKDAKGKNVLTGLFKKK